MKWLLKEYMSRQHIESFKELASLTGIEYRTLQNHMNNIGQFRVFELAQLDKILHFSDEDLAKLARRQI